MNLRQRMVLDSSLQKVHNETARRGDCVVGIAALLIGLAMLAGWL